MVQTSSGITNSLVQDNAAKSMLNYNNNSNYQSTTNTKPNTVLTKLAHNISKWSPNELNIGDFGCSHGLNSMECIKSALEGYLESNNLTVQVYLNDLPDNDFTQVSRCLADSKISYEYHELFHSNRNNSITSFMSGRSFYKPCLPKDQLHIAISYNSLHWLEEPIVLLNSIVLKTSDVTKEEQEFISNATHNSLVKFLNYRANELKSGGYLIMTVLQNMLAMELFNLKWKEFLTLQGYTHAQLRSVTMPAYPRTKQEVQLALDQVQSQFKIIQFDSNLTGDGTFSILALKATTYNTLLQGLMTLDQFKTSIDTCKEFLDQFYDFLSIKWVAPCPSSHFVVLERL